MTIDAPVELISQLAGDTWQLMHLWSL